MAFEVPLEAAWVKTCSVSLFSADSVSTSTNGLQVLNPDSRPCLTLEIFKLPFLAGNLKQTRRVCSIFKQNYLTCSRLIK